MGLGDSEDTLVRLSPLQEDILTLLEGKQLQARAILEALWAIDPHDRSVGCLYSALQVLRKKGLLARVQMDGPQGRYQGERGKGWVLSTQGLAVLRAWQWRRAKLQAWGDRDEIQL